jgi:hypothetical protein
MFDTRLLQGKTLLIAAKLKPLAGTRFQPTGLGDIVPGRGLEPLRISPPDPKSGASANFATLAPLILSSLSLSMYN